MRMQLKANPFSKHSRHPAVAVLAKLCAPLFAMTLTVEASASNPAVPDQTETRRPEAPDDSSRKSVASAPPLVDTTTKHASLEFAGYGDTDHVKVITPSVVMSVENVSGASLSASYLVDVVSAASVDVISTASTRSGWGEIRHAGAASVQYKPHDFGVAFGGSVSSEPDYFSDGGYGMIIKDFDEKNWTLNLGYGYSHDVAGRCGVGGACTPFSVFSRPVERGSFNGGVAWVVGRESLASLTVDAVFENGDQSKPYRYIAMFAPSVAATIPLGASFAWVNAHRLPEKPLEQLPLSRSRFALSASFAHRFETSTLRLDERIYDDTWGLLASSTDLKWILDLGPHFVLWPHGRFHVQSPVTFWQRGYVSEPGPGFILPQYRTGDRELGPLWTADGGLGLRWTAPAASGGPTWRLGLTGDVAYTSFLDDLYVLYRTAVFGALQLQTEW
jgi:hypothetical protein